MRDHLLTNAPLQKPTLCYDPCKRSHDRVCAPNFSRLRRDIRPAQGSKGALAKTLTEYANKVSLHTEEGMNNQLRPLTLGEILDRTAELYRNHFLLFAGISAIFAGTMLLVQMLHLGALTLLGYPHIPPQLEWVYAGSLGIEVLAVALVAGLAIAAFNRAVAWIYLGEPATVRSAASSVLSGLRRYLWLMAVTVFRAWAPLYVLYVALFAILFAVMPRGFLFNPQVSQHASMSPSAAIGVLAAILILAPLFVGASIYGVFMWLRYSLAMPACVVEGLTHGTIHPAQHRPELRLARPHLCALASGLHGPFVVGPFVRVSVSYSWPEASRARVAARLAGAL